MAGRAGFDIGYVASNQNSNQQISAGTYSLSARSTVPFVALVGSGGYYKTFSWGEIVEVPDGEACTVRNASYHGGDIFLNAGCDYDNRPARITVPVPIENPQVFGGVTGIGTVFPVDTRLARRAYFVSGYQWDGPGEGTVYVIGQQFEGSLQTANELQSAGVSGAGYYEIHEIWVSTTLGNVPLGKRAVYGVYDAVPHTLLTCARVLLLTPAGWSLPNPTGIASAYYTVEY